MNTAAMRRLFATLVLLLAWMSAPAQELAVIPPLDGPVVDTTMTLGGATKQALDAQARALQQRKGSQLQVLVVPTTQPEDIAQYAVRAFEQYKLGRADVNDGVLLVIAKNDRRARIEVGYGLEGAIPDATAARVIQEYLLPRFRTGDFDGGVTEATGVVVKLIDGEALPAPMAESSAREDMPRFGGGVIFAVMAAIFASQVLRLVFGWVPGLIRSPAIAAACGVLAWLVSHSMVAVLIGAFIGLLVGSATRRAGRYARDAGFGGFGGGWGGGGGGGWSGGSGGGGWSGGGGMSGGGGASGSW